METSALERGPKTTEESVDCAGYSLLPPSPTPGHRLTETTFKKYSLCHLKYTTRQYDGKSGAFNTFENNKILKINSYFSEYQY